MKYTSRKNLVMRAQYRSWEPEVRDAGFLYRGYSAPMTIDCHISVTILGNLSLICDEQLQEFGIVHDLTDAGGTVFMDDKWYQIQRTIPVLDSQGYITGYRHTLAYLAPELVSEPINPPEEYPNLDQG